MKTLSASRKAVFVVALAAVLMTMLVSVTSLSRTRTAAINITVLNNTSGDIKHLFLSPPDSNLWSSDQLNDVAIAPGNSAAVSGASCDQANLKLIAEDQNGCFIYQIVSCSSDVSWTIPNDATRDCGN